MNCQTCSHAIFDPIWGEYKCEVKKRYIKNDAESLTCRDHKKGTPKQSLKTREDEE